MCSCDNKPIGQSAEDQFREAFVRLRNGQPRVLPLGTAVTQSNVSREAGCDPSALRKTRYPELISEIQKYVLRARGGVESDRDHVMSLLLEADNTILQLTLELAKLRRVPDR
jgi:hypothetical protein